MSPPSSDGRPSIPARAKAAAREHWTAVERKHPALGRVWSAWRRFQLNNGSQYAAAITYYSFLALFPLLLLAVAVAGFVLNSHPAALQSLFRQISDRFPGSVGSTLTSSVQTAIKARTGVGIVGFVGVLLTGLGWVGNLRAAIDAVWGVRPPRHNVLRNWLASLLVLAGLGLAAVVSVGLTVVATEGDQLLRAVGLGDVTGLRYLLAVLGPLAAVAGDLLIFLWLLVRLPGSRPPRSVAVKGALFASLGFEALKVLGTYTIARTAHSPTAGPFAGLLAVLIWFQLVARLTLLCAAWMAVATEEIRAEQHARDTGGGQAAPARGRPAGRDMPDATPVALSPLAVAGSLLALGAGAGAAAVAWASARRGRRRTDPRTAGSARDRSAAEPAVAVRERRKGLAR